jgi:PucR C-terminal helix-turn-helix domain
VEALPPTAPSQTRVAGAYLPCLLTWASGDPTDADLVTVSDAVRSSGRCRLVPIDRRRQLLLAAGGGHLREAIAAVAGAVGDRRPDAKLETLVGQRIRPGEHLEAVALRLSRVDRHRVAHGCEPTASPRHYSLACLLERLDARDATAFVHEQLAGLAAHDREHGTKLLRVLELALDQPDRNAAARAAFMHRNTFRRQLRTALELIDADLDCPEERLALHLALKVRALGRGRAPSTGRRERMEKT